MVTAPKSSNQHSAQPVDANSPKFPRKNLPSPWAQVVRGGEPESAASIQQSPPSSSSSLASLAADQAPSSDSSPKMIPAPSVDNSNTGVVDNSNTGVVVDSSDGSEGNAGWSKKPAWNKPSNGVVEVGVVMGAESWPALSASTKASAKLATESSSKTADGLLSTSQGSITSQPPQKQATTNAKPNSSTNHNIPNRQRPIKRVGGNNIGFGPAQSSFSNPPTPPPPPPFPIYQLPPVSYGNMVSLPGAPDSVPRDPYRTNNWDARPLVGGFVPPTNDHRGSSRRGYLGPHPRGDGSYHGNYGSRRDQDGSYHGNYGSRRDQDRGNYVNTRDPHVAQPRIPPRGLPRHTPPTTAAFVGPQPPIGPFANPVGFSEFYYYPTVPMEHFRGMPFFTHSPPPTPFFPIAEPLSNMIVHQIEYYFSDANLVKDGFLRSKMDEQGWVPVTLIANFPRVRSLTTNIQLILECLRPSTVVEIQGDKLRRRNEWMRWVHPPQPRAESGSISPGGTRHNNLANLATDFQTITLEETITDNGATDSAEQSQISNGGDPTGRIG